MSKKYLEQKIARLYEQIDDLETLAFTYKLSEEEDKTLFLLAQSKMREIRELKQELIKLSRG